MIPKPIRERLHIGRNTELLFDVDQEKIIVTRESGKEFFDGFLTVIKDKIKPPKQIDWDEDYVQ